MRLNDESARLSVALVSKTYLVTIAIVTVTATDSCYDHRYDQSRQEAAKPMTANVTLAHLVGRVITGQFRTY